MPFRQKLKRRFGKDHERPIVMKPKSDEWHEKYDQIDWNKNSKEDINESRKINTSTQHNTN